MSVCYHCLLKLEIRVPQLLEVTDPFMRQLDAQSIRFQAYNYQIR